MPERRVDGENGARAAPARALKGRARAPGDKSISHRALIFAAMAEGEAAITGLLEGDDVLRTAAAMRALGASVERDGDAWRVVGAPWAAPARALYFGNSGTGCRLVMGAAAGRGIGCVFDGDASLRSRPMGRIADPLKAMGADIETRFGGLPVRLAAAPLQGIDYTLPVPSAQVKSAVLLAGLGAEGVTTVYEPIACRDHTERMLEAFSVRIELASDGRAGRTIRLAGGQALKAGDVDVPGDPSSAAFPIVAALITPGSDVLVDNVLLNPLRAGLFETLEEMGADLSFENRREAGGEPVADIRARHSALKGVEVPVARAPAMIDEYPVLAVAAAFADGETHMPGIGELRVKETDRIAATEAMLKANGARASSGPDWLKVHGLGGAPAGGGAVETRHDHRIAMSALVLGLGARAPVSIDDASMIATSFPNFFELMAALGADIARAPG